jgi:hypothetical protein
MANQVLRHKHKCRVYVVSGELAFEHVDEDEHLNEVGRGVYGAAAGGVEIFYLFPDPDKVGKTLASESAPKAKLVATELAKNGECPEDIECLLHDMEKMRRLERLKCAAENIHLRPIDPSRVFEITTPEGHADKIVAGEFLCPIIRFAYYRLRPGPEKDKLFILRSFDPDHPAVPYILEATDEESERFTQWLDAVL